MSTPPIAAMTPPPGADDQSAAPANQTGASPSPAEPSPAMQQVTQSLIGVANTLRAIAKAYPAAAPFIAKINEQLPKIGMVMMQNVQPGEPQAGPTG